MGRNSTRWSNTSTIQEKLVSLRDRISENEAKLLADVDVIESYIFFERMNITDSEKLNIFTEFGYYFHKQICNSFPDSTLEVTFPSALDIMVLDGAYCYVKKYGEFTIQTINNLLVTSDVSDNFIQITGISGRVYDMQKSHTENGISYYRARQFSESDIDDIEYNTMIPLKSYTKVSEIAVDRLSLTMITPIDLTGVTEMFFYSNVLND